MLIIARIILCFQLILFLNINCSTTSTSEIAPIIPDNPALSRKIQWTQEARQKKNSNPWYDVTEEKDEILHTNLKEIGVATLVMGKVTSSLSESRVRTVKKGTKFIEGEIIKTGKNSTCTLELSIPGAPSAIIKLSSDTTFKVSQILGTNKSPVMGLGKAFFSLPKNSKSFKVESSTWTAGVRGTHFEMNLTKDSDEISVTDGTVAMSPNLPELEVLSEKNGAMQKLIATQNIEIKAGSKAALSIEDNKKFLQNSNLVEVLKSVGTPEFETKINLQAEDPIVKKELDSYILETRNKVNQLSEQEIDVKEKTFLEMKETNKVVFSDKLFRLMSLPDKSEAFNMNAGELDNALKASKNPCSEKNISGVFVAECKESISILVDMTRDMEELYKYSQLYDDNNMIREGAYKYFMKGCKPKFKAVNQKLEERLTLTTISIEEKKNISKTLNAILTCK